jgi:diguanylate cyclase (GGDEF)-like protein
MELFRNVGIKSRIIVTTILAVLLPVVVFGFAKWFEIAVTFQVMAFLINFFLLTALFTAYMVGVSVTRPLERVKKRVSAFVDKRTAVTVNDHGEDEINELAREVDHLFSAWNQELSGVTKKQKTQSEERNKLVAASTDSERQLGLTRSCLKIAQKLNTTFDFSANLKTILDEAVKTMSVQWASILLVNRDTLEMTVACVRGMEQSLLDDLAEDQYPAIKLKPNEGLAGQVIKSGIPLIANKGFRDPRFKTFSEFKSRDEKVASILCAPIKSSDGTVLGVMNFINRITPPLFRNEDIPFAEDLCLLVSLVVERNRLFKGLFSDETTGMISHKVWREYFKEEASRAVRYSQPLSLVVCDIDRFKDLQEVSNPDFSVRVSAEIGKTIHATLRDVDIASRVQDRYYLLLVNTDAAGSMFFVGRVKEAVEKLSFEHNGTKHQITLSAGVAAFPETGPDARMLIENALKALEQAKSTGRDRAVLFGSAT